MIAPNPEHSTPLLPLGTMRRRWWEAKPRQVCLSLDEALSGILVLGSCGSGKAEALLSMAREEMARGGGLIYFDGMGFPPRIGDIMGHANAVGRLADVRVINLMENEPSIHFPSGPTHTLDLFDEVSAAELAQWMCLVLDPNRGPAPLDGGGLLIRDALWDALAPALVARRAAGAGLTLCDIHDALTLDALVGLSKDTGLCVYTRHNLAAFLDHAKPQAIEAVLQHARALLALFISYKALGGNGAADMSLVNSVREGHLIVIGAPSLEKGSYDLQMVTSGLLAMVAIAMQRASKPSKLIIDEFNLAVTGPVATFVAAMVRGSGASMIVSTGHFYAITEILAVMESMGVKVFLKNEDPEMTIDLFNRHAGPDLLNANPHRLQDQREGQAHVVSNGRVQEIEMIYHHPVRMRGGLLPPGNHQLPFGIIPKWQQDSNIVDF